MKKKLIIEILLTIVILALLSYKYIPILLEKQHSIVGNNLDNNSIDDSKNDPSKIKERLKGFPIGQKIIENDNFSDKEEIHMKIINSIDNFDSCQGDYTIEDVRNKSNSEITFVVDAKNSRGFSTLKGETGSILGVIYSNNKKLNFDDASKTYREFHWEQTPKDESVVEASPTDLYVNSKNRLDCEYIGFASDIINAEVYKRILYIYNDWSYEEVEVLNRPAYKITGNIDKLLSESLAGPFTLIVDKATGVVIEFQSLDENGKVKYLLKVKNLRINESIDENVFNKDLSEYTKIDKVETNK